MTVTSLKKDRSAARVHGTRPHPWPLRLVACVLIVLEVLLPSNAQVLVAAEQLFAQTPALSAAPEKEKKGSVLDIDI